MKFVGHLVPLGGLVLSILMSTHPLVCLLFGLAILPTLIALERADRGTIFPATNDPYAAKPAPPPGPTLYVVGGMALVAIAASMVTWGLPLPAALARQPYVAGGFYYCLGGLFALGLFSFYLAWSAKRGAAQ